MGNYDEFALTHEGKLSDGTFKTPMGVRIYIYKNWLYIYDQHAWRTGSFAEPTVAEIKEGVLRYFDLNVAAARGPQEGIYFAAWTGYRHLGDFDGIVGVGCYAYETDAGEEDAKWLGVEPKSMKFLKKFLQDSRDVPGAMIAETSVLKEIDLKIHG